MFRTFDVTLHYKSGAKQTLRHYTKFNFKRDGSGATAEWASVGNDRILLFGLDDITAIFYTHNTLLESLWIRIRRYF